MDSDTWSQPAAATSGSGSHANWPPDATRTERVLEEASPVGPGRATVAATVRSTSAAPGPTSTSMRSRSPPIGPAAPPTRWTSATGPPRGPVHRGSSCGSPRSTVTAIRPGRSAHATIRAKASITPRRRPTAPRPPRDPRIDPPQGTRHGRQTAAPGGRVAAHDVEVGPDQRREVGLVDDQQIGARDARTAPAWNLVAAGNVDHEDLPVDQAPAERCGQVVAAALDEHQVQRRQRALQILDGVEIRGDVVADRGVRAAPGLHRAADSLCARLARRNRGTPPLHHCDPQRADRLGRVHPLWTVCGKQARALPGLGHPRRRIAVRGGDDASLPRPAGLGTASRQLGGADQAVRSLAAFLADKTLEVAAVADINDRHIEDFIRWLAARPGKSPDDAAAAGPRRDQVRSARNG